MQRERVVLNEWILHDLTGENGPQPQVESRDVLDWLELGAARLLVLKGSPWAAKAQALLSSVRPELRLLGRQLNLRILRDSRVSTLLDPYSITPTPAEWLVGVPGDDAYLVATYYAGKGTLLVSHDAKLVSALQINGHVQVVPKTEFVAAVTHQGASRG